MKKSILLASFCHAQEEEFSFPTDRPGNVWGSEVMPFNRCSWENGFSYERDHGDLNIALPSTIFRLGIFHNVELRIGTDFLMTEEQPYVTKQYGMNLVLV